MVNAGPKKAAAPAVSTQQISRKIAGDDAAHLIASAPEGHHRAAVFRRGPLRHGARGSGPARRLGQAIDEEQHSEPERAVHCAEPRAAQRGHAQAITNQTPRADAIAKVAAEEQPERVGREIKSVDQPERALTYAERVAKRRFDDAEALPPEVVAGIRDPGQPPSGVAIRSALVHR